MLSTFCLRVKGITLKQRSTCPQGDFPTTEGYQRLLPNSPEGSPEGVVDHEVDSKVGTTHSLERF
jgi:hypothetical protein